MEYLTLACGCELHGQGTEDDPIGAKQCPLHKSGAIWSVEDIRRERLHREAMLITRKAGEEA